MNTIDTTIKNKSPLRYPGGKTRACKVLDEKLREHFGDNLQEYRTLISPFFGGGSFEFYLQHKYKFNIIANDKFTPLSNFWNMCKHRQTQLCDALYKYIDKVTKADFIHYRDTIMNEQDSLQLAVLYFIINRCSFSGATLSGGFSEEASKKRFTTSSIDRIKNLDLSTFTMNNQDFEVFINENDNSRNIIFLDPPYYLGKNSKLYGKKGDMHETFDHKKLFDCLSSKKNWMMTYNNCDYIKKLYKNFKIIETNWSYGMCNVKKKGDTSVKKQKPSSEIVIIG